MIEVYEIPFDFARRNTQHVRRFIECSSYVSNLLTSVDSNL
jgi:hypothetical protein